jgi:hypothetical protein
MKKKIIGIFVCILLFSTTVPAVSSLNNKKITIKVETSNTQSFLPRKWNEIQKLLASDGSSEDRFGFCYLDDDTAVISAPYDDDNGANSGSAYVFNCKDTNWSQQAKLITSDGAADDNFGNFISFSDDTLLIGADYNDDNGANSGSAYVFTRAGTNWSQQAKLVASDGAAGDNFGSFFSFSDDTILIGVPYDDDNGSNSGSAYVFTRSGITWTEQAKLVASDGTAGDNFGFCLSISGDTALIGAPYDDDKGANSGSAYVFTRSDNTWTQQAKISSSDGTNGDTFGIAVSLYGDTAFIGAPLDDDNGDDSGSVYVFCQNQKPNQLNINGPTYGTAGTAYTYTFNSVDPDDDDLYFYILWGDGYIESWDGPQASGTDFSHAHTYNKQGLYTIEAKAKDTFGAESGWSTMIVNMHKNKAINRPFQNFIQSNPNLLPILQKIIQRLELQ